MAETEPGRRSGSPASDETPVCHETPAIEVASLTARNLARWDRYIRRSSGGTFFHTVAWMHSVRDAFGHTPRYLLARRAGRITGVLPMFQINSLLGGRMLVSVPYAVGGGVVADDREAQDALIGEAKAVARRIGVGTIELRSDEALFDDLVPIDRYVMFRKRLPDRAEDVLSWLPRKARAAARNAQNKHGLVAEFSPEHLPVVWRLYCRSMRRLASINYPYRFFEELHERNRRNTHVLIVRHGGRIIAGLVSFRFGETFTPYFVGCDARFNRLGTNNFLYMTAMRRAVETGCRVFDFGRTRVDNIGCCNFKRFCGFEPQALGYQRWLADGERAADLTPSNPAFGLVRRVWPHLPLPISRRLGAWVSRHVPG